MSVNNYYSYTATLGGDPHYSVLLPSNQLLCFTIQGEPGFIFNLIHNKWLTINAQYIQDKIREEVTWISRIGVNVTNSLSKNHCTTLRFESVEKLIYINEKIKLEARNIANIILTRRGFNVTIASRAQRLSSNYFSVQVQLPDIDLRFSVDFMKDHLDILYYTIPVTMVTKSQTVSMETSNLSNTTTAETTKNNTLSLTKKRKTSYCSYHGIIGQFFCPGHEIDEIRKLLIFPLFSQEPIPVMRRPVWSFMERESVEPKQLCWTAMNTGYQGKGLIKGHYLDYVMSSLLSTHFIPPKRVKT